METAVRIEAAKRPVILAGAGVIRAGAAQNLALLAEATHIPLATTFMAKGILPADHDQTLFTLGQPENDYIDLAMGAADLVIAVGFDPVEYSAAAFTDDGNIPVLSVDTRPSEADAGWQLAGHLLGSLPETLDLLRSALSTKGPWPASATLVGMQSAMRKELARQVSAPDATRFAPQDICAAISRKLRPEDTVLSGVGLHKLWIARHLQAASPGQIIIPNGLAGMGLALPGALAAASLKDEGRVLAICGDGDLLMNVQEMETAARLHARLTVVVWEDGGYGLIEEHQGEDSDVRLSFANPGWGKLAAAFGWSYAPVHTLADLSEVLDAGLAAEGPTLITVQVDYGVAGGLPKARAVPENSSDPLEH